MRPSLVMALALVLAALIAHGGYLTAFLADAGAIVVFTLYLASVLRRPTA